MLIDTHCHLADPAFGADVQDVLARAWGGGVGHMVVIGESRHAAERALELAAREPRISVTAGVHPHDAAGWNADTDRWLRAVWTDPRIVAAGEMGLDYHYDHSPRPVQREVFDRQLALAVETGKPAVIHAREADEDLRAILENHPRVIAILHSFSSGLDLLRAALGLGHYVSFSGMITFKTWQLDAAIHETPLDRLLVETDAPYLAPVPNRGHRNEPGFVRLVAERLAAVRGLPVDDLIAATTANALRVFGSRLEA